MSCPLSSHLSLSLLFNTSRAFVQTSYNSTKGLFISVGNKIAFSCILLRTFMEDLASLLGKSWGRESNGNKRMPSLQGKLCIGFNQPLQRHTTSTISTCTSKHVSTHPPGGRGPGLLFRLSDASAAAGPSTFPLSTTGFSCETTAKHVVTSKVAHKLYTLSTRAKQGQGEHLQLSGRDDLKPFAVRQLDWLCWTPLQSFLPCAP